LLQVPNTASLAANSLALDNSFVPDLIAQGPQPDDRWRRNLQTGDRVSIGRKSGRWSTPWDSHISRKHVEVACEGTELVVQVLPGASNPVFFRGQPALRFRIAPGEQFVIGKTTFLLIDPQSSGTGDLPGPTEERTFVTKELHQRPFREPDKRIQSLSRLPDVIHRSANNQELFQQLGNLLLTGVVRATAAAVVSVDQTRGSAANDAAVSVLHRDHRLPGGEDFRPSRRLIRQAVMGGQSMAYVWGHNPGGPHADFTSSGHAQWAICAPVPGKATPGWALYVAGNFAAKLLRTQAADSELLHDDVKYTEIMAATLGGLLQSRRLAAQQASLRQFFSAVVLDAIAAGDADQVLAPREAEVTVLFCDLRGFTSESERSADDLFGLLNRVSGALGVMTREILEHGGVIGDFHGDAAMGFWGWPVRQADSAVGACRAALGIRANFTQTDACRDANARSGPPHSFRVGIGIASGRAVAGKIGTADQVKVTAFGPVVNLASRLEAMTKQLPASILVDAPTAAAIRGGLGSDICRVRRLARVVPAGLSAAVDVCEVLPPHATCPEISDDHVAQYETALAAFEAGDWRRAEQLLQSVPHEDRAKDMLLQFMLDHDGAPPDNWDGALKLSSK
jgi:adenylate cyclase